MPNHVSHYTLRLFHTFAICEKVETSMQKGTSKVMCFCPTTRLGRPRVDCKCILGRFWAFRKIVVFLMSLRVQKSRKIGQKSMKKVRAAPDVKKERFLSIFEVKNAPQIVKKCSKIVPATENDDFLTKKESKSDPKQHENTQKYDESEKFLKILR